MDSLVNRPENMPTGVAIVQNFKALVRLFQAAES